jgi:hypothetical protein
MGGMVQITQIREKLLMSQWIAFTNPKGEHCAVRMDNIVNLVDTGKGTRLYTSIFQEGKDGKPVRVSLHASEPIEHFLSGGPLTRAKRS